MEASATLPYEIKTEKIKNSRLPEVDLDNIIFGRIFTDHMFMADYKDGAWKNLQILPFQKISLSPAATVLHYGQEIFEGLKAYKDKDGNAYLFRPQANAKRINHSAYRMSMPQIPEELFMEGLQQLVSLDKDWIPTKRGSSLYIRPFMIATDEYVGIKTSENYKFIIFCCPVTAYYSEPIKVKVELKYVRAGKGGTGEAKTGGNYAASLLPVAEAAKQGYKQMLWTDEEHEYFEESGTMNLFFVVGDTVLTPELDGCILEGITRDSVLTLLREEGYKVEERRVSVKEIVEAYRQGKLMDAFGTGTAATIAQISAIGYKDEVFDLPPVPDRKVSNWLLERLEKIKRAEIPDRHGWLVKLD